MLILVFGWISLVAASEPIQVGQQDLRRSWEAVKEADPVAQDAFKKSHFLVSLPNDPTGDSDKAFDQFTRDFSRHFFSLRWIGSFVGFVGKVVSHPFDSISTLLAILRSLLTPLGFALLFVLFFHLWYWAVPISKDFPKLLRSTTVFRIALVLVLAFGFLFQSLLLSILIFSAFTMAYSRRPTFAISQFVIVALIWAITPLTHVLIQTAERVTALEALREGRTRLEYSDASLLELDPLERAYWADWNGARDRSREWIIETPAGLGRDIYTAIQTFQVGGAARGLAEMQKVDKAYPQNPYVLFNLAYLNVQTQNLVDADKSRSQIPSNQLNQLNRRALKEGVSLLNLPPRSASNVFFSSVWEGFTNLFQLQPFKWLYFLGLPFLLALIALFQRPRASGICDFTGEVTPRLSACESPLYLSSRVKNSKTVAMQRNQIDAIVRSHHRRLSKLIQSWAWLVPDIKSVLTHRLSRAVAVSSLVYSLLYISLPRSFRVSLMKMLPTSHEITGSSDTLAWVLLGVGLIVYVIVVTRAYRRSAL